MQTIPVWLPLKLFSKVSQDVLSAVEDKIEKSICSQIQQMLDVVASAKVSRIEPLSGNEAKEGRVRI